jgi:hypothetical protein
MKSINLEFQEIVHFNNFIFLVFSFCTIQVTDIHYCIEDP